MAFRKHVNHPIDGLNGAGGMQCRKDKMPGLRRRNGQLNCFEVAHLSDENDVGIFAQGRAQGPAEGLCMTSDFSLTDQAAVILVNELDRIFDGNDVRLLFLVDGVNQRRQRCAFA